MSVETKTRFLDGIKARVANKCTVTQMNELLDILVEELSHYEMNDIDRKFNEKDDLLKAYINALRIEGRSEKTLKRYEYIIKRMLKYLQLSTAEIGVFDLRKYLGDSKERGIADRTIDGERQIFSAYFGWLHREGLIKTNPTANIGAVKWKKKVKDTFSEVDIERLKKSCKNKKEIAIITFLMSTGCRVSEMTSMNREDVNLPSLECKVREGKGGKERIVYLDKIAAMYLRQYLRSRKDDNVALFSNKLKERLNDGGVRHLLKNIEQRSGVVNVHPHKFRRTLATNLIKRGMPIQEVAAILGHDKLDTTMEYVVLDKSEIEHSYRKCI